MERDASIKTIICCDEISKNIITLQWQDFWPEIQIYHFNKNQNYIKNNGPNIFPTKN
ncbi:hypothetical protein [Megavirus chiliensis]|uniref:Uncharacterized protein n=2 Tax=Megamimivirinae TaxID=3044648 RepID=A0A2L2DNY5_MIMIV|nr:hypothetical protein MegaChil _gp1049 [Megavirus chiliensis]AEQ32443.1 hypothetical protein [Megavirus chiliensis]AVG47885.1 hypothetical protein [Acanthamoeba polyphaga mimivirus]